MVINDTISNTLEAVTGDPTEIALGRCVALHLQVAFQDGFVAFSTFDEEPIVCTIGDGTLTPAFETQILGLTAQTETQLSGNGSELFAAYDADNVHWLERSDFPSDLTPTPGQVVAFEAPDGQETSGIVVETDGERVRVDFNHPFAGRALQVRIAVLSVS